MNHLRKVFYIGFLVVALSLVAGCTFRLGSPSDGGSDGGVWKSVDNGNNWEQTVSVPTTEGKTANIANINVQMMVIDPQDHQTIYLATEKNGVIYTYDGGQSWRQFNNLQQEKINAVAVDPHSKCTLYAVSGNKLFKSDDCGRFWENPYFHQNSNVILTDVEVDPYNTSIILMTTSDGEVLKSSNRGQSWVAVFRVSRGSFLNVVINPQNNKIIYAATSREGIYKTIDGGDNWSSLGEGLRSYSGSHEYRALIIDKATPNSLILISRYGMLRSRNGGDTWDIVNLLPAPKSTTIYSVAVNPQNSDEIYYTTRTTLVKSIDGGVSWSSQKLPFSRLANQILIDGENTDIVYLGTAKSND